MEKDQKINNIGNRNKDQKIKCVVWDLDHTIWEGILSEDKSIKLNEVAKDTIIELDRRGILQSISSKNNSDEAIEKLRQLDLDKYFIYPQINWDSKSKSIQKIVQLMNIGIDTIAFIDDQEFEIDEVRFYNPEVLCIHVNDLPHILKREEFIPKFITEDSKRRREMYLDDIKRKQEEEEFSGTQYDFLKTLNMEVEIFPAALEDLKRVEELTIRTNQLNSTGYTYTYKELCNLIEDDNYKLFVVNLADRYGDYGRIGIILIEMNDSDWFIKLFLLSCRVMTRGIGSIVLNYIKRLAIMNEVKLYAEFKQTNKNRMMYTTLMFNGFKECEESNDVYLVCEDLTTDEVPDYIKIKCNY